MYSPVGQNPPGMLDQGSQVEHTCCWRASCWIFQILSWITLVAGIIMAINGTAGVLGAFGACYLIYIILEFCTPTSRYLCHKSTDQGMYEKMGRNFKTPPEVLFHCECYHYETRHHTRTKQDGTTEHYTTQERVTTYTETYSLPYYSERDVSGLFYLNCAKAEIEQKFFIKLELKEEINFADAISYYDYQAAKRHFWIRNRFRDVHFRFWEDRRIPGMDHHNLVKMGPVEPCAANWCCFFLCVMVMGGEFFRLYIDNMSVYQKFKVRKLISTRYDLNQPVYQVFIPQLDLISQQYTYQPEQYNYVNQAYDLKLPTQDELEQAQQYANKIPNYQVSSGGEYQNGVIMDNPSYSSYAPNEPPPEFAVIGGDVALDSKQINAAGGPPAGFDQPGFQFQIAPSEQQGTPQNQNQGYSSGGGNQGYSSGSGQNQGYYPPPNNY